MNPLTAPAVEARGARRLADLFGADPVLAVVGEAPTDDAVLRAAGWQVAGRLVSDPTTLPPGVPRYRSVTEVLADPGLDGVCVDAAVPGAGRLLAAAAEAHLHALVPAPGPLDAEELRAAVGVAEDAGVELAVAFASRWQPGYATASRMVRQQQLPLAAQVTVRGWPRGAGSLAELVDLLSWLVGDVVAVAGPGAPLPADTLPDGLPVRLALLTEVGATVLVADGGEPGLRLSTADGALTLTAGSLAWAGGATVRLDDVPLRPDRGPALGPEVEQLPAPAAPSAGDEGLTATAARLALAARAGDSDALEPDFPGGPRVGTGRDLLVSLRVLDAVAESLQRAAWVEI